MLSNEAMEVVGWKTYCCWGLNVVCVVGDFARLLPEFSSTTSEMFNVILWLVWPIVACFYLTENVFEWSGADWF